MADPSGRDSLKAALDQRAEAGNPAVLWWRDDDATGDTPALRRLLGLAVTHRLAPVIAAIPLLAREDLAEALEQGAARVAVHGIAHRNNARAGEKKCELGASCPVDTVLSELDKAKGRLSRIVGARLIDMLVPPWNRIAPAVAARLGETGFGALSVFGPRELSASGPGIMVINTHIDIIDWRGTGGGRASEDLFGAIACLVSPRNSASEPIGLLTHHLVHDDAAWRFLDDLFELAASHPGAMWSAPCALMTGIGFRSCCPTSPAHE